jgi:general secretion pathway protein K
MIRKQQNKQNGIALISVLIVVAIVTTIVSLMWDRQHQNFKYTQYLQQQQQALNYINGVEILAKKILLEDNIKVDSSEDDWAKSQTLPIQNGLISAKLIDLQSKVNLNNLFNINNNQILLSPDFSNCLNIINSQLEQVPMTDYLLSFLNDTNERKKLLSHLSQLNKITTIETKDIQKIKPFLTVLKKPTLININTASREVLMCLGSDISDSIAKEIISNRPFKTLDEIQNFLKRQLNVPIKKIKDNFSVNKISVNSHYFLLETVIDILNFNLISKTLLKRHDAKILIQYRTYNIKFK